MKKHDSEIILNGEKHLLAAPTSIAALLEAMVVDGRKVAVEVNQVIIPKSHYTTHLFAAGDVVEIVGFIGGG